MVDGIAGCIDVETTGLYAGYDEVVELALVLFSYVRETGDIVEVLDEYVGLREPGCSIGAGASRVHGIAEDVLAGKCLDTKKISALLNKADFIISHNVNFDYGFVVPLFPVAAAKPWYCSMNGIGWRAKGFRSKGLQNLLADHGIDVARSHRALDDVKGVVELLQKDNAQGMPYFGELIKNKPAKKGTL